jgi:hypothetical protein
MTYHLKIPSGRFCQDKLDRADQGEWRKMPRRRPTVAVAIPIAAVH